MSIILNVWIHNSITPDILLAGVFSGLSSIGLHQTFKNILNRGDNNEN